MRKGNKRAIWELLLKSKEVILTTHVRPDGDGIASELALSFILTTMGKKVHVINQDRTPEMYAWLPGSGDIVTLKGMSRMPAPKADVAVLLDCSSKDRIGKAFDAIRNARRIVSIDHHEDSECFRDDCYIDPGASSIGELLYFFVPRIHRYLDRDVALCIYVSIMTDTGSFAFSNTSARVFQVASRLLGYGVDAEQAFRMTYQNKRIHHFRLLAKVLELLRTDSSRKIAYVLLPSSVYRETGATEEDNEGILEVLRGIREVELIIMLRQIDKGHVKGSLRSLNSVNCNALAKLYGGGGHLRASGFTVEGDVKTLGPKIVKKIVGRVKEMGWA